MPWAKFDDRFISHPKVLAAGPLAIALHMRAIVYSALHLTDGIIRRRQLNHILCWEDDVEDFPEGPPRNLELVKRLVNAGLWEEAPEGEGWQIHDYLDWNPSREQAQAISKARSEAGRKAGLASGASRRKKSDSNERRTNDEPNRSTDVRQSLNESRTNDEPNRSRSVERTLNERRTKTNPVPVPVPVPSNAEEEPGAIALNDLHPEGSLRAPPVVVVPLVSGEFEVTQCDIDEWVEAYPGVDVVQQLRAMRQWSLANPTKRKTARGARRFIASWLNRQQNEGHGPNGGTGKPSFADMTKAAMEWAHAADEQEGVRGPDESTQGMLPEHRG